MKVGDKVQIDLSYGILSEVETIKALDSGHPLYLKDYYQVTGCGDPVPVTSIKPFKTNKMIHPKIETLRTQAMRAYGGISFDPEKRGKAILSDYSEELTIDTETINKHGGDVDRYQTKYISLLSAWLGAQGRCMSTMITGPANFPVRRMEKINNSERNHYDKFRTWRKKVLNAVTRGESTDIVKGSNGAIDKMKAKLLELEALQNTMKGVNKIVRDKKLSDIEKISQITNNFAITEKTAKELLNPSHCTRFGYATFSLTNNNAKIRNLKQDIIGEQNRAARYTTGNKEYKINDINVVENVEANRIQILFDGKPDPEMITKLKQRGFRWSPRFTAWQRQLTVNGIHATRQVLS